MSKASTKREGEDETAWDRFGYESDEDARKAVEQNITTLTRFDPKSMGCFGLRNVQTGIPFFFTFSEDGKTKMVNMAIGCRLAARLLRDAVGRQRPREGIRSCG